ncbi:serine/threonine-protein kinase [Haliangium ochraceum]|nr:serine/threonine-protein kinase [Haliangium ochraceum]
MNLSLFSNLVRAKEDPEIPAQRSGSDADNTLRAGEHVGDYVLREHVATGGFGSVWRAEHPETGEAVAVKVLHPYLVSSEEAVSRFEREIRLIARIQHPNIVELIDCGRLADGRPFLITEFLDGVDLEAYIDEHGAFPPERALPIVGQVVAALTQAHDENIVHRDLKASNVVLTERDGKTRAVLVDFGIAKLLDDSGPGLTMSNVLVGSLACLSPEQIRNRAVDQRTDIYALGALIYHMLTGEPPFANASVTEIINLHLDRDPPLPSSQGVVPATLDSVIMRAMRKKSDERYSTPSELLEALRDALEGGAEFAPNTQHALRRTRALGILVEAATEDGLLANPDDALLDDLEDLLMQAETRLEGIGFRIARERNNSLLFTRLLSDDELFSPAARVTAVQAGQTLFQDLVRRPGRDPRVHVRVCLHEAELILSDDELRGGPLLQVEAWAPATWEAGVFRSPVIRTSTSVLDSTMAGEPAAAPAEEPKRTGKGAVALSDTLPVATRSPLG